MLTKQTVYHFYVEGTWSGRSGHDEYFVGLQDTADVLQFMRDNFLIRHECGDHLTISGHHSSGNILRTKPASGEKFVTLPIEGYTVKINRRSCD